MLLELCRFPVDDSLFRSTIIFFIRLKGNGLALDRVNNLNNSH